MRRETIGWALAAGVAIAAAGCGGNGGSSASVSKEDFIRQADAICTNHDQEFASELQPTFPKVDPTSPAISDDDLRAFEAPLAATHELRSGQVEELRALVPPEDFEGRWETILGHLDTSVAAFAEAAAAAGDVDREAIKAAFDEATKAGDAADQVAVGYGFEVCGQT